MNSNCPTYKQKLEELKNLHNQLQEELEVFKSTRKSEGIWETRKKIEGIVEYFEEKYIATNLNEINELTKRYIGEWNIEVFNKIKNYPNITEIYEEYPDKKVFIQTLETDPSINSPEKAEQALKDKNIYLSDWGKDILYKTEFSQEKQEYELVIFTVEQLGFSNGATTDEIYTKAKELGLELCPAEVGPHLRLQYPGKEWMLIAMKQITDRLGSPDGFTLSTDGERLGLGGHGARSDSEWDPDDGFVFLSRK